MTFVYAYGFAHLRPMPAGPFPEGWQIYAMLAIYVGLGAGLVVVTSTFPRRQKRLSEVDKDRYWIVARDKPGLLMAMMRALAGNASISFEGDLSRCVFSPDLAQSHDETEALVRNTAFPRQDFIVLPLEQQTVQPILDAVLAKGRFFLKDIIHIQIEKNGRLGFGAYDNFHHECIVAFHGVSTELLARLQQSGVIRSWTEPYEGARRWHG